MKQFINIYGFRLLFGSSSAKEFDLSSSYEPLETEQQEHTGREDVYLLAVGPKMALEASKAHPYAFKMTVMEGHQPYLSLFASNLHRIIE